jgi:hypothetical protein
MKKIRGDKSIQVIICIYMEILQGNSLSTFISNKQKHHFFSFFLPQNLTTGGQNRFCPGVTVGTSGRREEGMERV